MNLEEPYLNEEICFLEWLDEFSKRVDGYQSVRKNFLNNVSLLPLNKKEILYSETLNPNHYINLHAIWSKTKQGHEYWGLLETKWKAFLFNIKIFEDQPEYNVKNIYIGCSVNKIKKIKIHFEGD
jgi:hypothetical protein